MGQTWWRASWGSRGRRTTSCWPNCPMSSVAVRWPPWPPWRRWRIADARRVRRSSAADASAGLARRLVRRAPRAPWLVSRPAVNRRRLRPTVPSTPPTIRGRRAHGELTVGTTPTRKRAASGATPRTGSVGDRDGRRCPRCRRGPPGTGHHQARRTGPAPPLSPRWRSTGTSRPRGGLVSQRQIPGLVGDRATAPCSDLADEGLLLAG